MMLMHIIILAMRIIMKGDKKKQIENYKKAAQLGNENAQKWLNEQKIKW